MSVLQPCVVCGEVSDGPRCAEHRPTTTEQRGLSPEARGYDAAWRRLSARARAVQPWCSDAALGPCGGPLTADHKPEAWRRKAAGLEVRLVDVDVVCAHHNAARGSSRPGSDRAFLGGEPASGPRSTGTQGEIPDSRPQVEG